MVIIEKRQAYRIDDDLIFEYKKLEEYEVKKAIAVIENNTHTTNSLFPTISNNSPTISTNISTSGMAFITKDSFELNTNISISIQLTNEEGLIYIIGQVHEFSKDIENNENYVRITFEHISETDQEILGNYAASKLNE